MTFSSYLAVALGALISLSTGCRDSTDPVGTPANPPGNAPAPQPPPLARPRISEIYERMPSTQQESRYVLYEDKTFALQFFGGGDNSNFEYQGRYSRSELLIMFSFYEGNIIGPWEGSGTLRADSLSIKYNPAMSAADFVDGVYVRRPGTP